MNVCTPGSDVFIWLANPGALATDARIGRSPVASENACACALAVSHSTNFSAAFTCAAPLLNSTQLSGPEIVWWPLLDPGKAGMICTPYCTWLNPDRSHGPVTTIPILPELKRVA